MTEKTSKKAWVAIVKGSALPLIIGVLIFVLFWRIYEIYNLLEYRRFRYAHAISRGGVENF